MHEWIVCDCRFPLIFSCFRCCLTIFALNRILGVSHLLEFASSFFRTRSLNFGIKGKYLIENVLMTIFLVVA